jgi:hypothetical protein
LAQPAVRSARSCLMQGRTNALDDDRETADDELVGKSKNTKPPRRNHASLSASLIFASADSCVRPSASTTDFSRKTNEIREIRSNWGLSAKAVAVDLMISQHAP